MPDRCLLLLTQRGSDGLLAANAARFELPFPQLHALLPSDEGALVWRRTAGMRTTEDGKHVRGMRMDQRVRSPSFLPFNSPSCSGFYTQFAMGEGQGSWTEPGRSIEMIMCIPSAQSKRVCSAFYENISEFFSFNPLLRPSCSTGVRDGVFGLLSPLLHVVPDLQFGRRQPDGDRLLPRPTGAFLARQLGDFAGANLREYTPASRQSRACSEIECAASSEPSWRTFTSCCVEPNDRPFSPPNRAEFCGSGRPKCSVGIGRSTRL